ncbi:MFS transporter [Streptomyces sp. FH025]|uniref:MFS transporter n=1 Tax=Streptomyces sp. FH025 TaxID=2815937 RepID=UPI001A9F36E7|nr:MFS transporter [Streptomyces sp. FH025]MBO1415857.1 MFS transporter [Streptomyces sp. FH025]
MTESSAVKNATITAEQGSYPPESIPSGADGGWRELLSRRYAAAASILAGGVALYAMNLYFTAALMPSIVADIGGERYYAWVATGFLMAAVIASMLVSRLLDRLGAARAYVLGFLVFGAGAVLNAASPSMAALILGRVVQGLGGGLVAGLGYAVIRSALPERLWTRAAGLVSAMWGVGTLVGPSLGGLFAQLGAWRLAYVLLLVAALVLALLARRVLPGPTGSGAGAGRVPLASLVLLTLAAAAFSVSSTVPRGWATGACIVAGLVLLAGFALAERRGTATVLPHRTYRAGNGLKWLYLTVAVLCGGVIPENFIPLFGQGLGGLGPLVAGFLGAAISAGWTSAQLFSVNITSERGRARAIRTGPVVLTVGLLAYGLLQTGDATGARIVVWAVVLFVAGTGIGLAFPHLSVAAMSSSTDPVEGGKAAAALNTTQLISYAVVSALAGTLISLGGDDLLASARYMTFGIAVITLLGVGTAALTARRAR